MTLVDVVVPIATKSKTNARGSWHGRARDAKAERNATALTLLSTRHPTRPRIMAAGGKAHVVDSLFEPPVPCEVTLVRLSERYLDDDNVRGALKSVRDAVAAWLGVDDRDARVTWKYGQEQRKRGHFGVRIVISTIDETRGAA